jgi:DNA-binding CsgD family transcriptional regulator
MTQQQKCQVAALGAKGKTVEEIAQTAGLEVETVREFLSARSSEKTDDMPKSDKKAYAIRLFHEGKTRKEIIELTELSRSAVYALLPATKGERKGQGAGRPKKKPSQINEDFDKAVNEMITEAKKEPAPAATDTDSTSENINCLYPNDTIDEPKSQVLNGVDFIGLFEGMLHEGYGDKAKIVKVSADKEKASVIFECEGREYNLTFGRYA